MQQQGPCCRLDIQRRRGDHRDGGSYGDLLYIAAFAPDAGESPGGISQIKPPMAEEQFFLAYINSSISGNEGADAGT